jgi:hypothetical protein
MQTRPSLSRRVFITGLAAAPLAAAAASSGPVLALGAAWRGPREDDPQQLGVLDVDVARGTVAIRHALALPSRAHGLRAEPDGALLAVAARPGRWLLRLDRTGHVVQRHAIEDEDSGRSFDGHALASADGQWLYTGETDARGDGWLAVRARDTLRKADQWRTHGIDPHQMVLDGQGDVLVANGGIPRGVDGRKRDLDRMRSSLVLLDRRDGSLRGQWTLDDPRLSLRHLAWRDAGDLLGIALQAEHDDAAQRARAPLLALWDGERLTLPLSEASADGYAGDIATAPLGGFALSAQRTRQGIVWWPQRAGTMNRFAELQAPCALAVADDGSLLMASGAGLARWHPTSAAALLRWPQPMALDNHWVLMQA